MKKNHFIEKAILSDSQIDDFQAKNYSQVKLINCYLGEIISFITKKFDIRDWGQSISLRVSEDMAMNTVHTC